MGRWRWAVNFVVGTALTCVCAGARAQSGPAAPVAAPVKSGPAAGKAAEPAAARPGDAAAHAAPAAGKAAEPAAARPGDAAAHAAPAAGKAADPAAKAPDVAGRARFVVQPFVNVKGWKALDYLPAGLPAFVAERLARHPGLRFVGGPSLLGGGKPEDDVWVVGGRFERRPDWKLRVTVELSRAGQKVAEADAVGSKEAAPETVLAAALAAFDLAHLSAPPDRQAEMKARFGRDPYAFVLYGRGIAAFLGLDGKAPSDERAVEALGRSIVIDPKVPETRRYLGQVHLSAGRPGHARAMWSYALEERPGYAAVLAALAALDRTAGAPTARERYGKLLDLEPDNIEARRAYGELLSEAGMLPQAQAELEKVTAAVPGDVRARRALALVLASRRAGAELVAELAEIARLDPDDLDARFELGAAQAGIGRLDDAVTTYEDILKRRPRNPAALKLAADVHRARGDAARAAAHYERLRRIAPDDPRPVFLLGATYFAAGRLDAAERVFLDGTRYPGMLGDAYSNLGAIALRRGHNKEAMWFLGRAAQRRPGKAGVRYNYALALDANDRPEDALVELKAAAGNDPQDAGIRFTAGVVALRLGRLKEAEDHFREAVRLDPAHEDAKHNLALLEAVSRPGAEGGVSLIPPAAP